MNDPKRELFKQALRKSREYIDEQMKGVHLGFPSQEDEDEANRIFEAEYARLLAEYEAKEKELAVSSNIEN